jgi:hypothetical protein
MSNSGSLTIEALQPRGPNTLNFPKKASAKSFRRDILEGISSSLPVFNNLQSWKARGYPLRKSFKRDILRGYLENSPFVFIDLAGKHVFGGIYPVLFGNCCEIEYTKE